MQTFFPQIYAHRDAFV